MGGSAAREEASAEVLASFSSVISRRHRATRITR
jgi:hypothetical protein